MNNIDQDTTTPPKDDKSASAKPINLKQPLKAIAPSAIIALICGLLLVGVVAGFEWGQTILSNTDNTGSVASAWSIVLTDTAIATGLMVAVGLPIYWARTKGYRKVLEIFGFELVLLIIALLISGHFIFSGSNNDGGVHINPGGPVCGAGDLMCNTIQN